MVIDNTHPYGMVEEDAHKNKYNRYNYIKRRTQETYQSIHTYTYETTQILGVRASALKEIILSSIRRRIRSSVTSEPKFKNRFKVGPCMRNFNTKCIVVLSKV